MTDLMERLRAADPVRDELRPPPVEALLARLDEAEVSRPSARPRGRRSPLDADLAARGRRSLVPVVVAMAIVALVVGLQQRSMSPDVVAEARQALGTSGEVIHVITRMEHFFEGVEDSPDPILRDRDGRALGRFSNRTERWTALDPLREHSRFSIVPAEGDTPHTIDFTYADGVTQIKQSWNDELQTSKLSAKRYERARGNFSPAQPGPDPVAGIRRLLAGGDLEAAGETSLDGRRVLRLVADEPRRTAGASGFFPAQKIEYLVDAQTFEPVRITIDDVVERGDGPDGRARRVMTFEVFERLPATPQNLALLRFP